MQLVQTGVPTDSIEAGEARQAIADQNPKLDPNDAEGLAGSAKEIPGVDFDKADAPITNAMKQELADVMGVDAVGEEEITKAMKMLGVHTGMESVQEDAGFNVDAWSNEKVKEFGPDLMLLAKGKPIEMPGYDSYGMELDDGRPDDDEGNVAADDSIGGEVTSAIRGHRDSLEKSKFSMADYDRVKPNTATIKYAQNIINSPEFKKAYHSTESVSEDAGSLQNHNEELNRITKLAGLGEGASMLPYFKQDEKTWSFPDAWAKDEALDTPYMSNMSMRQFLDTLGYDSDFEQSPPVDAKEFIGRTTQWLQKNIDNPSKQIPTTVDRSGGGATMIGGGKPEGWDNRQVKHHNELARKILTKYPEVTHFGFN